MNNPKLMRLIVLVVAAIVLISFSSKMFLTIDPGHKGVLFQRFTGGLKMDKTYGQGFHVIAPWNIMYVYDVRILEDFENMEVLSKNGLTIKMEMSYLYQPKTDKVPYLHNQIGADYQNRVLIPAIRSVTREVIGAYLPEELYSTKREAIEDEIYMKTSAIVDDKHVYLDKVLIRDVSLPPTLQAAIERKLQQEQEALEYEFRLEKARKEAERKEIEAEGISEFQSIITRTITPSLLKWKGIEATEELAKSQNAKVVVIGSGDNGLPLILGGN